MGLSALRDNHRGHLAPVRIERVALDEEGWTGGNA
jgi:hypothetical protein